MTTIISIRPNNNHMYPHLSSSVQGGESWWKQIYEHRFRLNEVPAKYWLRLKFPSPRHLKVCAASSTVCQSSMLLASQALPYHHYTIFYALLWLQSSLCDHNHHWGGEVQLGDHYGGLGKSCSFHCPHPGFNLLNRLIRIERAWPMPHEKLP